MTKDAELHADEDKKRKEGVETRNQLDSSIYGLEKTLKESGDKLAADVKAKIETALADAKKDLESGDIDKQKAAMENLQKVGAELYAAAAQQPGADAGGATDGGSAPEAGSASGKKAEKKADVVDADFEVVDEEKSSKK